MKETPQQYAERVVSYVEGKQPLQILQTTPRKLTSLLKGKSKKQLRTRPEPDKWSVTEVAAHLADAEVAIGWRFRQILSTNGVSIQGYDQNAWASTFNYARRDPRQSLESFAALRAANVALLKSVSRKLWENYGMHSERGKESVARVVSMVAGHDLNHLRQIESILKEAVRRGHSYPRTVRVGLILLSDAFDLGVGRTFPSDAFDLCVARAPSHAISVSPQNLSSRSLALPSPRRFLTRLKSVHAPSGDLRLLLLVLARPIQLRHRLAIKLDSRRAQ